MSDRPAWVVTLVAGKSDEHREVLYVRAATDKGAIRCAKFYSSLRRGTAYVRLATPRDLGCVQVQA